ncbi:HNH endonuclease [Pseudomonas gingeri]|uniref:HNH endonuclease n=1 Tax=Pseudomonas gingeri TaxID=117681 RepID=A0A7Y7WCW8_9PSED|nr:HNH endonuclease [Pseudomonas gingeri]NWB47041.1 HNH endonuclease [Pseudomonas gingeri]
MATNTAMPLITDLQKIYVIDPVSPSGLSRIKATRGSNGKIGPVVSMGSDGYYRMKFQGRFYRIHRIIYFMHTGTDPAALVVDHIDGNRLNNRIENLRACTVQQNLWNAKGKPKRSGLPKGIEKMRSGDYRVRVSIDGDVHLMRLGSFGAAERYLSSVRKHHHGEFARA